MVRDNLVVGVARGLMPEFHAAAERVLPTQRPHRRLAEAQPALKLEKLRMEHLR